MNYYLNNKTMESTLKVITVLVFLFAGIFLFWFWNTMAMGIGAPSWILPTAVLVIVVAYVLAIVFSN